MRRGCLLIALCSILLSGCQGDCNRYELVGDGEGRVYRLDKKTGEIWFVAGTESYRTKTPKEIEAERQARAEASRRQAEAERRAWEAQVDAEEPMSSSGDAGRFDAILDQVESEGSQ